MIEEQQMFIVDAGDIKAKVARYKDDGYRLVQIGSTTAADGVEVNYSLDKDYAFINLKVMLKQDNLNLPSVSDIYLAAFLYENEIHDLFGVTFSGMVTDFAGHFYRTTIKTPFNPEAR